MLNTFLAHTYNMLTMFNAYILLHCPLEYKAGEKKKKRRKEKKRAVPRAAVAYGRQLKMTYLEQPEHELNIPFFVHSTQLRPIPDQ